MRWYWESSHFQRSLGDLVLRRMLADEGPADFGILLDKETIDTHLAEARAKLERWILDNAFMADVMRVAHKVFVAQKKGEKVPEITPEMELQLQALRKQLGM